jgi:hypothetical protein
MLSCWDPVFQLLSISINKARLCMRNCSSSLLPLLLLLLLLQGSSWLAGAL